jgi:ribosomal protein S18 acetylase RimI-like enzyme
MTQARIETLVQNEAGKSLYPSLGFEEIARQVHYCMDLSLADEDGSGPSM